MQDALTRTIIAFILLFSAPLAFGQSSTATTWLRMGGPSGGIGYDIKVRPDNPDVMYVTDAYAGVHKSIDGGQTWTSINEGIDGREGPS